MFIEIINKSLWVISVLVISLFMKFRAPAHAEKEVDTFYNGYKAYLKKDFKKAMYLWNSLAKAGNPDAQYKLGMTNLNG